MTDNKESFLVVYDYGMGGLWGLLLARSEKEIRDLYPELETLRERPPWMKDEMYDRIVRKQRYDIDAPPRGILKAIIGQRSHD